MTEFAVEWLRPDGWVEAGRGWTNREDAESDAREQLPDHVLWRVVEVEDAA